MERWEELAKLASGQRQLVATWQAGEVGIGRSTLCRRAQEAGWQQVRHRVYLLPGASLTPEGQILAVLLALKEPVLPSGWTAAFLWGLVDQLRRPIEVIIPIDRNVKGRGVRVRSSEYFEELPEVLQRGVAVPGIAHTICLLAAVSTVDELVKAISTAHRKRLTLPQQIRDVVPSLGPFKGVKRLRAALKSIEREMTHSGLERLGRGHLREAGLQPHPKPYAVTDDNGRLVAEIDIAFIAEQVAVEIFGPPHEGNEQADHDRRRRLEALGWKVIVAYEQRLRDQRHIFIAEVRRALAESKPSFR